MRRAFWLFWLICVSWAAPEGLRAQAPAREEGLFIALQPPITREAVNRVKAATDRALEAKDPPIRKIIYDFNPGGSRQHVDRLRRLPSISPTFSLETPHHQNHRLCTWRGVTGHAVLPVLACQEIVMSRDAMLGDAAFAAPTNRSKTIQIRFYENISRGRKAPGCHSENARSGGGPGGKRKRGHGRWRRRHIYRPTPPGRRTKTRHPWPRTKNPFCRPAQSVSTPPCKLQRLGLCDLSKRIAKRARGGL